ncbi:MAG: 4Fe-4S binding protein [Candidatus Bathyarchaeia archaeon]
MIRKSHITRVNIDPKLCKGCGFCVINCPAKIIAILDRVGFYGAKIAEITDTTKCIACGLCELFCPDFAVSLETQE